MYVYIWTIVSSRANVPDISGIYFLHIVYYSVNGFFGKKDC